MAKRKGRRSADNGSSLAVKIVLIIIIVLVSWVTLSVAFDFPFLDMFPAKEGTGDVTGDPAVLTPTPTVQATADITSDPVAAEPTARPDATTAPAPVRTEGETAFFTLVAYKDGQSAYVETMTYVPGPSEDDTARLRMVMDRLAPFLNYKIVFNSITLDENGIHIDLGGSGAPFVKDSYYYSTGIFAVDYPTYDSQVFGILDSICYTARECCGQSKAVYITRDGRALSFDGLAMEVTFAADTPYMGYSYYRENKQQPESVMDTGLRYGVPLSFAEGVRYYFKGTIGSVQADVTLTVTEAGSLVVLKIMSQTDVPIYFLKVEGNKVMVSEETETDRFTLYQDANDDLIGEYRAAGAALTDDVRLSYVGYELNQ